MNHYSDPKFFYCLLEDVLLKAGGCKTGRVQWVGKHHSTMLAAAQAVTNVP
jgi:hypothetical protein